MITNGTNNFARYALFSLFICATMFAVDQYLVLHPTTEASHETKAMKSYSLKDDKNNTGQVNYDPKDIKVDFSNPKFKKQIKLDPKFKKQSASTKNIDPISEEQKLIEEPSQKSAEKDLNRETNFFQSLKKVYQASVLDRLGRSKHRTDIIIRYYTHAPDGERVYALQKLGFYIHERPVKDQLDDYESNAIFYGDEVTKEDLQMVAYTLLQQGMPIKQITQSQFHDSWKSSSIEIGTDTTVTNKAIYTIDQIERLSL